MGEGRVYGGGLHKLEPRELGNASAQKIFDIFPESIADSPRSLTFRRFD
jgi:hypothetical protein